MISNKEWIQQTINHEETGRGIPYHFMFSPPTLKAAQEHYGENIHQILDIPLWMIGPGGKKPLYADPADYGPTITDEFGVIWTTNEIDRGAPIGPGIKGPSLANYTFPDPKEEWRFNNLKQACKKMPDEYRIMGVGDLWERATFIRGMEHLLTDVIAEPKFVEALMEGLTDYIIATMEVIFEQKVPFESIFLSDDYGTQRAMLISPGHWRRFIRPCLERIFGMARDHGKDVFLHSCGHIMPIIPDLIDLGLTILHPIQPEAMNIYHLKREFGKDLTFCGGLSTQDLLIAGTPDQIKAEVQKLKIEMGKGGGYILEPGITIQADVPPENMTAMIDEAIKG